MTDETNILFWGVFVFYVQTEFFYSDFFQFVCFKSKFCRKTFLFVDVFLLTRQMFTDENVLEVKCEFCFFDSNIRRQRDCVKCLICSVHVDVYLSASAKKQYRVVFLCTNMNFGVEKQEAKWGARARTKNKNN